MFARFWNSANASPWRLSGAFFVIGAVNAVGFFWHYHSSPIVAFFDAVFAIGPPGGAGWIVLQKLYDWRGSSFV